MFEPLLAVLASVAEVALTIAEPLGNFVLTVFSMDKSLGENSRMGESPLAHEGRRDWLRGGLGCLVLLLLVSLGGGLVWWWWG